MEMAEDAQLIIIHFIKQQLCEYLKSRGYQEDSRIEKYQKRVSNGEVA